MPNLFFVTSTDHCPHKVHQKVPKPFPPSSFFNVRELSDECQKKRKGEDEDRFPKEWTATMLITSEEEGGGRKDI